MFNGRKDTSAQKTEAASQREASPGICEPVSFDSCYCAMLGMAEVTACQQRLQVSGVSLLLSLLRLSADDDLLRIDAGVLEDDL